MHKIHPQVAPLQLLQGGTVGTVAENRLNRCFTSSIPLQKLVTDITEFK